MQYKCVLCQHPRWHHWAAPTARHFPPGCSFNVLTRDGQVMDYHLVEAAAADWNISLRDGCFCNPGASEVALGLTPSMLRPVFERAREAVFERTRQRHEWGMVRVSTGIATTPSDIDHLMQFLRIFTRDVDSCVDATRVGADRLWRSG